MDFNLGPDVILNKATPEGVMKSVIDKDMPGPQGDLLAMPFIDYSELNREGLIIDEGDMQEGLVKITKLGLLVRSLGGYAPFMKLIARSKEIFDPYEWEANIKELNPLELEILIIYRLHILNSLNQGSKKTIRTLKWVIWACVLVLLPLLTFLGVYFFS